MNKDVVTRTFDRLGWTKEEVRVVQGAPDGERRRLRVRPLVAGVLVWAGVFGLLWMFG
jgi:hypothetical protein